jgi:hypothetical protein
LFIIVGASAAALIVIGIIVAIVTSRPTVDYEKEAAKAVEARRKAFEDITSKPSLPAAAPPARAPEKSAMPATPAAPSRPTAPEVRPRLPQATTPAPGTAQTVPGLSPLPTDALIRVRTEVLTLHPYYLSFVVSPPEKTRLEGLIATRRGLPEDAAFIQSILSGNKLKAVRDEAAQLTQTIPTVEREAQEGLPTDKVTLADGRVLNCRILEEGPELVKVSRMMSSGVAGQVPLRRENITRLEKGKGVGAEFATRWETAQKGTLAGLVELLVWCKENSLPGQAKLVACTIVKQDPSNTQARTEAGLPADPIKIAEEASRGGIIAYQGRNWTVKELKEKFLKDGYWLIDGLWYSRKEKMISVPGLFRYERQNEKPVIFGGGSAQICHDTEVTYKPVLDPQGSSNVETPEIKYVKRFFAPQMTVSLSGRPPPSTVVIPPNTAELMIQVSVDEGFPGAGTPMKGEVTINVPLGEPLLEASVLTTAEVKAGGSITVYHVIGSGDNEKRTKLYVCEAKEGASHVIPPELIRGLQELNLVAVIEEPATYIAKVERRHARGVVMKGKYLQSPGVDVIHYRQIPDYKAELFPSNSNTMEVFRLKAVLAEPAPHLNKVFANPDLLK